jgi:hypothetical protein
MDNFCLFSSKALAEFVRDGFGKGTVCQSGNEQRGVADAAEVKT